MKTKLLTTAIVCALLISITGCAADNTEQMLHNDAEVIVNTETVTEPSADTQTVTPTAETAEKEIPAQPVSTEAPQTSEIPETDAPRESEPPKQTEPSKQAESAETLRSSDQSQPTESEKPVETQPEPAKPTEPPKETEQPKPAEPPAPTEPAPTDQPAPSEPPAPTEPPAPVETEPPVETPPKAAYDYEFDINAIRADCIAIGQGMGYTLNTSLTPQNATWWNPVTASESNQGGALRSALEQYIRFHTVANLSAYGMDEIAEFNICCESRGGGSYAIFFVFA